MKKLLSLLLSLMLIMFNVNCIFAQDVNDSVKFELSGLGLIDTTSDEPYVTRGEFADIAAKLLGYDEGDLNNIVTSYYDVPSSYEYAPEIEFLSQIGILSGVDNGMFNPYAHITYQQAIKVMVSLIGYEDLALKEGGWPDGYITIALRNKMLSGVKLDNPFSRESLYNLVYNTLDIQMRDAVTSKVPNNEIIRTGETLRENLMHKNGGEIYHHKGVVMANSFTYITSPYSSLSDDEVIIENKSVGKTLIYKIGDSNVYDFVGCEIDFFAKETESGYVILSVAPSVNNEVIRVDGSDFGQKSGNSVSYKNDAGKNDRITLENGFKLIYNGTRIVSPQDSDFNVSDGYIEFVNNDNDKLFEIVMVWEYENAIAESFDGERFNFAFDALFNNQVSLIVDNDNRNVKMLVYDKNGKRLESFQDESVVSIYKDKDGTRYTVIVCDDVLSGKITSISEDELFIDDVEYKMAYSFKDDFSLGKNYEIRLDYEGKLAFWENKEETNYAYILEYGLSGHRNSPYEVKMIIPDKVDAGVETNEEDTTDTSSVPYLILHNKESVILQLAESVKCDGKRYKRSEQGELLSRHDVKAVKYFLDAEGNIKEIIPLEQHGGDIGVRYEYDVYSKVFGGNKVPENTGFAINSDTQGVCIPVDQEGVIRTDASDEDLDVKVNITIANNNIGYRVAGYDYDESTGKVGFVVHLAVMDATYKGSVSPYNGLCRIVKSVVNRYDYDTDEYIKEIEIVKGSETEKIVVASITSENVDRLKEGDVVTVSTNTNGKLDNVSIIYSLSKLKDYFYTENISEGYAFVFGKVGNIEYNRVNTAKKRVYTKVEVDSGVAGGFVELQIPTVNTPPIYIYDRDNDTIQAGSYKDICAYGDDVFVFKPMNSENIRVIVLVR